MNPNTPHETPPDDEKLASLEAFELALDHAIDARLSPASLHAAVRSRGAERHNARCVAPVVLRPTGWRVIAGAPVDARLLRPTPGTLEADAVIFRSAPVVEHSKIVARLLEFSSRVASALAHGWRAADLHRTIDAAYWRSLSDMFKEASDHAFRARVVDDHGSARATV